MIFIPFEDLPDDLKNNEVKIFYNELSAKKRNLIAKRVFDIILSLLLIILLSPLFLIIPLIIKINSKGPIFYLQKRVTIYGKIFKIIKFRTMLADSDKNGPLVTVKNDNRITKVGKVLRKLRIDEIPQLFNVLVGDMSFVGTRPEVPKYVEKYSDEMKATLLMPAGVTSLACIKFKDENDCLHSAKTASEIYISEILPQKMKYNLDYVKNFNLLYDIKIMVLTVLSVIKQN